MKYEVGVNYWGSKYGIDMWKYWDEDSVRQDLKELSKWNVKNMRVFPNWRDFQPIVNIYKQNGEYKETLFEDDKPLDNIYGLDMEKIAHFDKFCDMCEECGIKIVVAIVTGWMSGRHYVPHALQGKNQMNNFESLAWMTKYVKGFVKFLKHKKAIHAWDMGNESNNMGHEASRYEAINWTYTIVNAIKSEDQTRKIYSGMHALQVEDQPWSHWLIQDQAEWCDMLTPHPYPSPTVGGHLEAMTKLRTTIVPTAQVELYSSIGGKPAQIQEQGTFTTLYGTEEQSAQFMQVNMWSGWANGSTGYYWWMANDVQRNNPPYEWILMENELGMLREDYSPKPVAKMMKKVYDEISSLPCADLPERVKDTCFIIGERMNAYQYLVSSAYVLAKQAGLEPTFRYSTQTIPEYPLYIIASDEFWQLIRKSNYNEILRRVREDGASLLITCHDAALLNLYESFGFVSKGAPMDNSTHTAEFNGDKFPFRYGKKFLIESIGAEILARDESDGTPVLTKFKYGKGYTYFLNCPLEKMLVENVDYINKYPYYKIYQTAGEHILKDKLAYTLNPDIAVTVHPINDKEFYAVAINYVDEERPCAIKWKDGAKVTPIKGDGKTIAGCDSAVFKVELN